MATQIGAWGRESGAFGWALGIGMMFSLVGWRWLRRDADPDRALACHRLADATFTALGAPDFAQQTLGDRALAHDASGNRDAALVASRRRVRTLPELQAQHPEWSEELGLREGELVGPRPPAGASGARRRTWSRGSRPALERVRARYRGHRPRRGLGASMPAELRDPMMQQAAGAAQATTSDLEWDRHVVPVYRALAARQKNPLRVRAAARGSRSRLRRRARRRGAAGSRRSCCS